MYATWLHTGTFAPLPLLPPQKSKVTLKQQKRAIAFPTRKFAVKA